MGGSVTGGAAGVGGFAALGGQGLFVVLQRFFGYVVLGQGGGVRVVHCTAHRAGLAVHQLLGQQTRAVGVQLALHGDVGGLQLIQSGLGFGVGMLLFFGVGLGSFGFVQILQQGGAGGGQTLGQLDTVLDLQLLGVALAQGGAGGLGVGDGLFQRVAAGLQLGQHGVDLALHLGGALFFFDQPGQLLAAGSAFLGNFYTGVAPGNLLVQVVHDALLALLVGLVKFQQALAQLGGRTGGVGVAVGLQFFQLAGGVLVGAAAHQAANLHKQGVIQAAAGILGFAGMLHGGLA